MPTATIEELKELVKIADLTQLKLLLSKYTAYYSQPDGYLYEVNIIDIDDDGDIILRTF